MLKAAYDELTKASHKVAEELYKQSAPAAEPQGAEPPPGARADGEKKKGDDVVDAEFEEAPRN